MPISLEPIPTDEYLKLPKRERDLQSIGDNIAYWLKWATGCYGVADVEQLNPDTSIRLPGGNAPPMWPSVGQLTKWLEVLRDKAASQ